jgi:hypothetical protein
MRAAAAVVLVLTLALPAGAASPPRATLKLVARAPLVVEGHSFAKSEQVVLTATAANAQRRLRAVARRDGSFTAHFDLRLGKCTPLTVRAVGVRGSRAILQVEPGCERKKGEGPTERALARFDPGPV